MFFLKPDTFDTLFLNTLIPLVLANIPLLTPK